MLIGMHHSAIFFICRMTKCSYTDMMLCNSTAVHKVKCHWCCVKLGL